MYAEEQDICLRAIKNQYKVMKVYSNKFHIYRSIDPISSSQLIWYYGSRNIFYAYRKNLYGLKKIVFICLQVIIYIKEIVKYSIKKEFLISWKIFKGLCKGLFAKIEKDKNLKCQIKGEIQ